MKLDPLEQFLNGRVNSSPHHPLGTLSSLQLEARIVETARQRGLLFVVQRNLALFHSIENYQIVS